ncbi:efflux RND transporter permease subunit [Gloeobacter kilaueensis]|uniref:Heavy metal efflux pump, CzcA family n=1 Tax=Gloeobacter kilaueensis (strain ATCC BAA-2537 / CCAP 1431/1 / ULC 316 / JS1) TaxID=1183438 RepID=U5QKT6_GLOK1|nr:efflux RND transporter permease subunit [Gloeobacter kilaueensis]AGY58290.1 heavy metal efflux pump, CzcA family [Gloeobacter kilaueensis JS1]
MLNRLILWSLAQRWLVVIASVALLIFGTATIVRLPLDVFPNFAPPQVVIQTEAVGLAPEEVESLVTLPLESALGGLPGLVDIRSSSSVGLSVVTIVFGWNTDIFRARQLVTERVDQVVPRLPQGAGAPILSPISSPVGDVIKYALTVDSDIKVPKPTALLDLAAIANWQIRNRLLAVPGVTRVLVLGGGERQYQVLVEPVKLKQYGVSLNQVTEAVRQANVNAAGGFLQTPDREFLIRGVGRIASLADLRTSVVAVRQGVAVRLADVARIAIGSGVRRGDGSFDGKPAVIVTVTRQPFADTPTVTRAVEQAMAELQPTLPKDVKVTTTFRQQDFIETSVGNVVDALRDGALIVAVILIFFLGNWRTMLVTLAALPLSIGLGLLALNAFGVGLNTMSLGGLAIALGEVIDDAIIDAENVYRRLRENARSLDPQPALKVIFQASAQIRSSVVFATLILCAAIAPVFVLSGVEGQIFTPLGLAYGLSILASLLVALTLTPALCYLLLADRPLPTEETPTVRLLKRLYRPILTWALRHPAPVLGGSLLAFGLSLALIPSLGRTFLPEFQERSLVIAVSQLPGASLASTQQIGAAMEKALIRHPEIETAQFRAGRAPGDDDAGGVNFGELDVQIAPNATDREKVLATIRAELGRFPGVAVNVGGFISHRIDEVLSGTRAAVAIKLFGPDLDILRTKAAEISQLMKNINGVVDLQIEPQVPVEQYTVRFDRSAAARYGLSVGQIAEQIETAFNGRVVSQVLEAQRLFNLVVWLAPEARNRPESLQALVLDTPTGQKIPLSAVATVVLGEGPNTINRQNVSRRIVISANVSGRDIGSLIAQAREKIAAQVQLPSGYYLQYGGQFEAQERATRELLLFGLLALLVVVFLLYRAVRSLRATLLILANLPLALIGGIVAVRLGGGVLSVASLVGFITLFGVANRNGIILVTTYYQRLAAGEAVEDALIEGTLERLSPVLMTALTAALAMLPLMIGGGAGKEILQPLAVVVFGGLFTSTALTLVVIPALFERFAARRPPVFDDYAYRIEDAGVRVDGE